MLVIRSRQCRFWKPAMERLPGTCLPAAKQKPRCGPRQRAGLHSPTTYKRLALVNDRVGAYRARGPDRLKEAMAQPVVVDLRNLCDPEGIAAHGFIYESRGV